LTPVVIVPLIFCPALMTLSRYRYHQVCRSK